MTMKNARQAAHEKAFAACDHTIEGRFGKGAIVSDYSGQAWKTKTNGIRYHEDVSSCIYGVVRCNGPKGWKQTCELRSAIRSVISVGIHEPDSRGGWTHGEDGEFIYGRLPRPAGDKQCEWTDRCESRSVSKATITIYDGGIVGVRSHNYDDSPSVAWVHNPKLAKRLDKAMTACPNAVVLQAVTVKARKQNLRIAADHPRYAAYAAAPSAVVWMDTRDEHGNRRPGSYDEANQPSGLTMDLSDYRKIKQQFDSEANNTSE